jgi:hypothetical protein
MRRPSELRPTAINPLGNAAISSTNASEVDSAMDSVHSFTPETTSEESIGFGPHESAAAAVRVKQTALRVSTTPAYSWT